MVIYFDLNQEISVLPMKAEDKKEKNICPHF